MRRLYFSVFLAAVLAATLAFVWKPAPIENQLLRVQLDRHLPAYANALSGEPLELQALFVDYASDALLVGKARLAMLRYPQMTRSVLEYYGAEPLFQQALKDYGDQAIPPIYYYLTHEFALLAVRRRAQDLATSAEREWRNFWGEANETEVPEATPPRDESTAAMPPERRGWYAVGFILEEGHDFLGQFVVKADGDVHQVQTERVLEALNSFFAGGVRGLESKYRRSEPVGLGDVGWAGVDLAIGISALKVLRMGRTARAGAGAHASGLTERSAALGSSLLRGSAIGLRVAKYGAPFALGYIVLRHPSVLNALFREVAEAIGAPVPLIQTVGWALALLPLLLLAQLLLRPLAALLSVSASSLRWFESAVRGQSRTAIR
ncbi:MAG: hypothetical protein C0607_22640 [Azoarcus sp.]|nr:MAG: hypothetical protein C0607_22640 [Azoarcus sp.]